MRVISQILVGGGGRKTIMKMKHHIIEVQVISLHDQSQVFLHLLLFYVSQLAK